MIQEFKRENGLEDDSEASWAAPELLKKCVSEED